MPGWGRLKLLIAECRIKKGWEGIRRLPQDPQSLFGCIFCCCSLPYVFYFVLRTIGMLEAEFRSFTIDVLYFPKLGVSVLPATRRPGSGNGVKHS